MLVELVDVSGVVDEGIEQFQAAHADMVAASSARLEALIAAETSRAQISTKRIIEKSSTLAKDYNNVENQSAQARDSMNNVLEEIKDLREDVKDKVSEGLHGISQAAAKISAEVISELEQFHTQLHTSYSGLGKDFKALFDQLTKQLTAQREEIDILRSALQQANRVNTEASLTASTQLEAIRDEEKKAAQEEKDKLKEQIFALIESSHDQQQDRLSSRLNNVQSSLVDSMEQFETADKVYGDGMDEWTSRDGELMSTVIKTRDDLKTRMKADWTVSRLQ